MEDDLEIVVAKKDFKNVDWYFENFRDDLISHGFDFNRSFRIHHNIFDDTVTLIQRVKSDS